MKVGIVGLGSIGVRHLENITKNADSWGVKEIVAFDPKVGQTLKSKWVRVSTSVEVCSNLTPFRAHQLDVLIVCTPPSRHYDYVSMFPEAHVLVEKPIAHWMPWGGLREPVSEREGRRMEGARMVLAAMNLRFHPGVSFIRECLASKVIGLPIAIRAWYSFEGTMRRPDSPDAKLGALVSAIHDLDSIVWATGAVSPSTPQRESLPRTFQHITKWQESVFEEGKSFGVYCGKIRRGGAVVLLTADFYGKVRQRGMEVIGSKGQVRYEVNGKPVEDLFCFLTEGGGGHGDELRYITQPIKSPVYDVNQMYVEELGEFFSRVRGEREPGDGVGWRLPDVGEVLELAKVLGVNQERGIP